MIANFLNELIKNHAQGTATEHSYRAPLQAVLQSLAPINAHVQNEPKRIQGVGAVDFEITLDRLPIAHLEAKDIGIDLRETKGRNKAQRDTYLAAYGNLCYTNGLEWDFYENGRLYDSIRIADFVLGIHPRPENFTALEHRLSEFLARDPETITSHAFLAERMAAKAQIIKETLAAALIADQDRDSDLSAQYRAFQNVLIHDISIADFADLYAETIAYGLFAARLHDPTPPDFSRAEAMQRLPKSNPFLRKLFTYIGTQDLDERVRREIDQLATLFLAIHPETLARSFANTSGRNDPYIHFYETFLAKYNPAKRKSRGVWFTPEPVVRFIVRAVDDVLKSEFGLVAGLADTAKIDYQYDTGATKDGKPVIEKRQMHRVQILDPATGTGTFLAEVVKHIAPSIQAMGAAMWSRYIHDELIDRLHGFELLMASYAMAHMKLDLMLGELGYRPPENPKRLSIYLTNSLEEGEREDRDLFGMTKWLTDEGHGASQIKRNRPIMCVIGNPPYSGESQNKGNWIMSLMDAYKTEPGGKVKLQERNPKWINDDYVKFIRMAEHMIEQNGQGVVAMITNHGYLDNPTFRGMRWRLMANFDKIYVLDLHGNAKKKELAPDGGRDVNVFDIQQGVGILVAVKTGRKKKGELARIFHADLWGPRADKYAALDASALAGVGQAGKVAWQELTPPAPNYFWVPKDFELLGEFSKGFSIDELFIGSSVGIVTARDALTIDIEKDQLIDRVQQFRSMPVEIAREKFSLGKDVRDWQVKFAQDDLNSGFSLQRIQLVSYRPFDSRWTYYSGRTRGFHSYPRNQIMRNYYERENWGLLVPKAFRDKYFAHTFVTSKMSEVIFLSGNTASNAINHPLYLYPDEAGAQGELLDDVRGDDKAKRRPNLDEKLVAKFAKSINLRFVPDHEHVDAGSPGTFHPLDLFDYIYAVLHSPKYRETYREFLKIDFPRLPYPTSADDFWRLVRLGGRLRRLHLMDPTEIGAPISSFPVDGDFVVSKPRFEGGRVYINDDQYFENVPQGAWEFFIGGYQPAQKWLKDRRGRALAFADIQHYLNIIKILDETAGLMVEIDAG